MEKTISRLDHIKQIRANRDNAEAERAAKREAYRLRLIERIHALAPRIKELFIVADELTRNGYTLGAKIGYLPARPQFVTDGIDHCLGFYLSSSPYLDMGSRDGGRGIPTHIGIKNGGWLGNIDLRISRNGDITEGVNLINTMEGFIKGFDTFEAKFYEYVDNLK